MANYGPIEKDTLADWFVYHKQFGDQSDRYGKIRAAGLALAEAILDSTPFSTEQEVAILKVREAVMFANAAIACNEKGE